MATAHQRREAYRMYRSMGYSAKEARSMRNRGKQTLENDYREARRKHTDYRIARYEGKQPTEKVERPYLPHIEMQGKEMQHYEQRFDSFGLPEHISSQMLESGDYFKASIYEERIEKLIEHFVGKGKDWAELMDYLDEIHDLGDWLDALGELYGEE